MRALLASAALLLTVFPAWAGDTVSVGTRAGVFRAICNGSSVEFQLNDRTIEGIEGGCESGFGVDFDRVEQVGDRDYVVLVSAISAYMVLYSVIEVGEADVRVVTLGGDLDSATFEERSAVLTTSGMGVASESHGGVVSWRCEYHVNFALRVVDGEVTERQVHDIPGSVCSSEVEVATLPR